MHLALSTVSQQALWVLLDDTGKLIDSRARQNDDQSQMSTEIGALLDDLLLGQKISIQQIQTVGVVIGPGAFTGLRMGVSFVEGLCLSSHLLKIPISTFHLVNRPFIFPLRHVKAPALLPADYFVEGFESLFIQDAHNFEIVTSLAPGVDHRGFKGSYPWPTCHDLTEAFHLSAKNPVDKLEIVYGLEPKIFGVRTRI